MERFNRYVKEVKSKKILTCDYVKLAIARHEKDLKRTDIYFDEEAAQFALDFFELLNLNADINDFKPFILEDFQAFIVGSIFGWMRKENGKRKYNRAYIEIARKNGKTFFAAGISLLMMLVDGEVSPQIFTGANSKPQAKICFKDATDMVKASPAILEYVKIRQFYMSVGHPINAEYSYLSADANKHDGLRPHCVILDEIHEYKTNALYNIFASAMGNRLQPLILMITTAGFNKSYWCYREQRRFVIDVLRGSIESDNTFGIIYTLDKGDKWQNPKTWIKSNPNLGVSVHMQYLKEEVHTATVKPSDRVGIVTKNFNVWMDAAQVWIPSEKWDARAKPMTDEELVGLECYGGTDLSFSEDITSYTLSFTLPDGSSYLKHKFYVPLEGARKRQEATGIPYEQWIDEGHLIACEGDTIDYTIIENDIVADFKRFNLNTVGFDRWNSNHIMQLINARVPKITVQVEDKGKWTKIHPCYGISQTFKSISPSAKAFATSLMQPEPDIWHDGNPVMAWMLANVELKIDPEGLIKPDKSKSNEKIDGVISTLMAREQQTFWATRRIRKGSVYDTKEVKII